MKLHCAAIGKAFNMLKLPITWKKERKTERKKERKKESFCTAPALINYT